MSISEEMNTEYAVYEEEERKEFFVVPEGTYPAHAWTLNLKHQSKQVKSRDVQGKFHVADIYELEYKVADDVESMGFNDADKLKGKVIRSNGVFVFKDPEGAKDCLPNPQGNWQYNNLLKVFGIKLKDKEIKDGKGNAKTVKVLPRLQEQQIKGKPCLVSVKHRQWEDKTYANVNRVDKWEKGKQLEEDLADIPF